MSYNRLERRLAALLDAAPRARRLGKQGYQRLNYLLSGGRGRELRLHPQAAIHPLDRDVRVEQWRRAKPERFFGYFGISPWSHDSGRCLFHRLPGRGDSSIEICLHDTRESATRVVGTSLAWTYQQGTMAQWLMRGGWYAGNRVQ